MDEDNVMPNDSTYFMPREPVDQMIERKKERAKTLEVKGVISELIERFDEQIRHLNSVDSMPDDVKKDPTKFMNLHNSHELSIDYLRSEKSYLESLLDGTGVRD